MALSIYFVFLVIAKVLDRQLILPKFHCYINEPAGCYLDAVFDTYLLSFWEIIKLWSRYNYSLAELGYFENSFLHNPLVPPENLQTTRIYLPNVKHDQTTLRQLMRNFDGTDDYSLIEVVFPTMSPVDGSHLSFVNIPDRYIIIAYAVIIPFQEKRRSKLARIFWWNRKKSSIQWRAPICSLVHVLEIWFGKSKLHMSCH